jgi:hypothetical protein
LTKYSNRSSNEISVYSGPVAKPDLIKDQMKKVRAAFPSLPKEFYAILFERVVTVEMTADRLIDSVNNVIDTCHYPTPTIADFISYDVKLKLLTYYEVSKMAQEWGKSVWEKYRPVNIPGKDKGLWARTVDINNYNLKILTKKKE